MTTISKNQRYLNIISKAIEIGFEIDDTESFEIIRLAAEEHLINNADPIEDYCPVSSHGRSQHVGYADRMGFEYECDGEIVDFSTYKFEKPETKIFHETIVNSLGQVVKLYDVVVENSFNTPVAE